MEQVRDNRKCNWFWADNSIIDTYAAKIGPYGVLVYMLLCRMANEQGTCWPSLATISEKIGVSETTVKKSLAVLVEHGLVSKESGVANRISNVYTLLNLESSSTARACNAYPTAPSDPDIVATRLPLGRHTPTNNTNITILKNNIDTPTLKTASKVQIQAQVPPELEWVVSYCKERRNGVDPIKWFDFYASKGWMVGKNKMKDWQAAVRTWERSGESQPTATGLRI